MNLERTSIQKAVKTLLSKNLVKRFQMNLSGGGYTYLYKIENRNEIKSRMKKIVHDWYKSVEKEIDKL